MTSPCCGLLRELELLRSGEREQRGGGHKQLARADTAADHHDLGCHDSRVDEDGPTVGEADRRPPYRVELAELRWWIHLGELDAASGWEADRWQNAIEDYFSEYDSIGIGPDARGAALPQISRSPGRWVVRQVIDDPEGDQDWAITALVDLQTSDEPGEDVVVVTGFGPV